MSEKQSAFMVLTWGCQMNDDDSLQMANLLEQMGYRPAREESDADVIMLNTCSVRAKPEQKVRSKLGELRVLKQQKRDLIIGVCGCMAQRDGAELLKRAPYVDLVMGTASIPELPALIQQIRQGGGPVAALGLPEFGSNGASYVSRFIRRIGLKMFVPVMYGCDNYCAYCVVPSARGPERSRRSEDIIAEITELASKGCREVTLIGQNVNSYGRGPRVQSADGTSAGHGDTETRKHGDGEIWRPDFADLLAMVNDVPRLERIRFTTSHPKDLSDRLIDAISELPKVCEHLHLPIQSGDTDILQRMGRGYTVEQYKALIDRLRKRVPGISLTTDVMVGFPGETERQFENTLRVVEEIRYDGAFMFAFNPRPGTAAATMGDQVDNSMKMRRLRELIALQNGITLEKNQAEVGRVFEVLVEGPSEKDPDKMAGYTRTNKTVNFGGSTDLVGRTVMVRAEKAHPWGFSGQFDR